MTCGSLFIKKKYYGKKCCDWQVDDGLCVGDEGDQNSNISKLLQDMKGWTECKAYIVGSVEELHFFKCKNAENEKSQNISKNFLQLAKVDKKFVFVH